MKIIKLINIPLFIVSLALGLFCVYVTAAPNKVIYVYPTPDNLDQIQYIDKANNCHKFRANEVRCNSSDNVKDIPIQK